MKWSRHYLFMRAQGISLIAMSATILLPVLTHAQRSQGPMSQNESGLQAKGAVTTALPPKRAVANKPSDTEVIETRIEIAPQVAASVSVPSNEIQDSGPDTVIAKLKPQLMKLERKDLLSLAKAYEAKKEVLSEIKVLELALARHPKDYVVLTNLGLALARARRYDQALARFNEAKEINANYQPAYDGTFTVFELTGDRLEAQNTLNDAIKKFGRSKKYASDLCRILATDDYLEKSVEACREAIVIDRKNEQNHLHLAHSLRDLEKSDLATQAFQDAVKAFPQSELVLTSAGAFHLKLKNFVEAHRLYRQAVLIERGSARALLGYAQTSFELQKLEEAMEAYVRACKADRSLGRELRAAFVKLRERKDSVWEKKYEAALTRCQ